MPGGGHYFLQTEVVCGVVKHKQIVDDASSAMAIVFLLFICPSELSFWSFTSLASTQPASALLDWSYV